MFSYVALLETPVHPHGRGEQTFSGQSISASSSASLSERFVSTWKRCQCADGYTVTS